MNGCHYNNDINKLKEMLGKRPDELEGETLKLFETIMKIADERDELKEKNKELEKENEDLKNDLYHDGLAHKYLTLKATSIPISKIQEKVIEIKNKPVKDNCITTSRAKLDTIIAIEELLEK